MAGANQRTQDEQTDTHQAQKLCRLSGENLRIKRLKRHGTKRLDQRGVTA